MLLIVQDESAKSRANTDRRSPIVGARPHCLVGMDAVVNPSLYGYCELVNRIFTKYKRSNSAIQPSFKYANCSNRLRPRTQGARRLQRESHPACGARQPFWIYRVTRFMKRKRLLCPDPPMRKKPVWPEQPEAVPPTRSYASCSPIFASSRFLDEAEQSFLSLRFQTVPDFLQQNRKLMNKRSDHRLVLVRKFRILPGSMLLQMLHQLV